MNEERKVKLSVYHSEDDTMKQLFELAQSTGERTGWNQTPTAMWTDVEVVFGTVAAKEKFVASVRTAPWKKPPTIHS